MIGRHRPHTWPRSLLASVVAGAAGTVALEMTSYLDMLARGRPASQLPAAVATRIADALHVDLGERATHRAGALGGLLGNLTGLLVGVGYGLARQRTGPRPLLSTGLVVGAAAMATSDAPATAAGVTNPTRWGRAGWVADIVPHAAYGLTTVAVHEVLTRRSR